MKKNKYAVSIVYIEKTYPENKIMNYLYIVTALNKSEAVQKAIYKNPLNHRINDINIVVKPLSKEKKRCKNEK